MKLSNRKGIALLVALGTMIVILILGSMVLYLIVRGLAVTSGQVRYETAYEAAVASMEVGKEEGQALNANPSLPNIIRNFNIGSYAATVTVDRASSQSFSVAGTAQKFARAIVGVGGGGPTGSYRVYYIRAEAVGHGGEQAAIEALYRISYSP